MANLKKPFSRRTFLKSAAAGATGIATTSVLAGCAPKTVSSSEEAPVASGSTPSFMSTESVLFNWRNKPEEPTEFAEEMSTEVVIIGAGIAGLNAARAAANEGAKVIVIEKKSTYDVHGFQCATVNSQMVKDMGLEIDPMAYFRDYVKFQQNRVNQELISMWVHRSGEAFDFYEEIMPPAGNDWKTDYRAVLYYDRPDDWQETVDTEWYHSYIGTIDFSYESWAYAGKLLYEKCLEMGVEFVYNTAGYMLTQDESGKVNGVIAQDAEDETVYKKFNAEKGIILACGNFATNEELVNDLCIGDVMWALRSGGEVIYNGLAANNGEGHKMAVWAGGEVEPWQQYSNNSETLFEATPGLSININGKRWRNEDTAIWTRGTELRAQPGMYAWEVFDVNWQDLIPYTSINHRAMDNSDTFWTLIPEGYNTLPDGSKSDGTKRLQDYIHADVMAGVDNPEGCTFGDYVFRSDKVYAASSLEKLAEFMGFDEEATATFLAEIKAYNEACEKGVDEKYGKRANLLRPIVEAPFVACGGGINPTPSVGDEGIRVDGTTLAVVRKDNGRPIGGLWAAGGVIGGRQGISYLPPMCGHNHGWCVTTGYVAGQSAAQG